MASPRNRHCANCIGTLSFPIGATAAETLDRTSTGVESDGQTDRQTDRLGAIACTALALARPISGAELRFWVVGQWRIQDFCKGGAEAGAFGVPQAPSCPLSLRPLRKFRGS